MDAKEFIKEHQRMCSFYQERGKCNECPAHDPDKSCVMFNQHDMGVVDLVEDWAKNHPVKTNRDALKEKFGTVIFSTDRFYTLDHFHINGMSIDEWLNSEYKEPKE